MSRGTGQPASTETGTIARILATGLNRHIREHGPDGDRAANVIETGTGHSFTVTRGNVQYYAQVDLSRPADPEPPARAAGLEAELAAARKALRSARAVLAAGDPARALGIIEHAGIGELP